MKSKNSSILLLIALITLIFSTGVFMGVGCGGDSNGGDKNIAADPGALPTLKTGDIWTQRGPIEGTEYELTSTVQGYQVVDGKDCYIVVASVNPPMYDVADEMTSYFDKATMFPVRINFSSELARSPFIVDTVYSFQFTGAALYPLAVGKEVPVVETSTTVTTVMGETETETETNSYTYKIESTEDVTVPAGTFTCFKIVKYDDNGVALETS